MRAVIQRVRGASVRAGERAISEIGKGLLILLAVGKDDDSSDAEYLAKKIASLRIFDDKAGKMNLSLQDVDGEVLVVSQFTLYGDCRKGNRPSFTKAAHPEMARKLYDEFVHNLRQNSLRVETGEFQAKMVIKLENDGPVTLILNSR